MSTMENKPFLLRPSGKDYLWGGRRLKDEFEKNIDISPLAETWECSTHPDGPSYVVGGAYDGVSLTEVLQAHPEYLGTHPITKGELPILIKFIDAKQDLSVQVHPTDAYAAEHENGSLGKTEMWYVLEAAPEAELVYGLSHEMTEEMLRESIADGTIAKYLQRVKVRKDDVFFVEAGTVHALGAGVVVAEIQENSNLTYRLYDYDRVDGEGHKRELHVEKAIAVARLESSAEPKQPMRVLKYRQGMASELLCRCKYFEVYRMLVNTECGRGVCRMPENSEPGQAVDYRTDAVAECGQAVRYRADAISFRVLLCVDGNGEIAYGDEVLKFRKGDCVFVPADSVELSIYGRATFLDVRG